MLTSGLLSRIEGVEHGFPGATDGPPPGFAHVHQVHSNIVLRPEVPSESLKDPQPYSRLLPFDSGAGGRVNLAEVDADGLVAEKGVVAVRTADCLPVLIVDRKGRT